MGRDCFPLSASIAPRFGRILVELLRWHLEGRATRAAHQTTLGHRLVAAGGIALRLVLRLRRRLECLRVGRNRQGCMTPAAELLARRVLRTAVAAFGGVWVLRHWALLSGGSVARERGQLPVDDPHHPCVADCLVAGSLAGAHLVRNSLQGAMDN